MFETDFQETEVNIPELVEELKEASNIYYNFESPIMSDEEYDQKKDLLKKVDPNHPYLSQIGSPTPVNSPWKKFQHKIPMGSLNKVNTVEEFTEWGYKFRVPTTFILTPKYDGLSLNCEYENGKLVHALSRGQGEEGEDYYQNAIKVQNLPKTLPNNFTGSLRGEILIHHDDFNKLNEQLKKDGLKEYKNPRNACAILRRLDGLYSEFLSIVFYNCVSPVLKFNSLEDEFLFMKQKLEIEVSDYWTGNFDYMCFMYGEFEAFKRENFAYDLDGLVIMPNDNQIINQMGETYGNRTACIAWKFGKVLKESKVLGIRWDMGKTGKLTPVVEIEPVRLLGTDVKSVNIYNMDYFKEYNLGVGDIIKVFKANDIIPKLEEVVKHVGPKIKVLETCPTCGSKTEEVGKFLECSDDECPSRYLGNLQKYVEVLGIMNISEGIIEKLYDEGIVKEPSDFYTMKRKDFSSIEGLGEKSYDKIMSQFHSKMEIDLATFIGSLNILQISSKQAEKIVNAGFDTLEKMNSLKVEDIVKIKGFKEKTARKFVDGLKKKKDVIHNLLEVGIKIGSNSIKEVKKVNNKLDGLSFIFTGAIEKINPITGKNYKREELQKMVSERGGINHSSVQRGSSFLVQADPSSQSSKTKKALQYGTKILSEKDFFKMLED